MSAGIVLDHLTITVTDLDAAAVFYDAALGPLGLSRSAEFLDPEDEGEVGVEAVSWAGADAHPVLWVVAGRHPTSGLHVAFAAPDDEAVRRFHAAGVAAGGRSRREPRDWEIYRPGGFGAMVTAPEGTVVEALVVSTPDVPPVTLDP